MAEEDLFGSESEPESTTAQEEPVVAAAEEDESELVVEVAELPTPRESATLHTLKLPASLRVVPEPFDAAWHVPDASAAPAIRWRYGDGGSARESNARLVRWADGSLQLFVGGVAHDVAPSELPGDVRLGVKFRGVVHCHGSVRSKLAVQPPKSAAASSSSSASAAPSAASAAAAKARVRLIEVENDPEMEQPHKAKLEAQRSSAFSRRGRAASGLSAAMLEDSTSGGGGNAPLRRSAADDATEAAASKRLLDAKAPHPQQRPQQRPRKF